MLQGRRVRLDSALEFTFFLNIRKRVASHSTAPYLTIADPLLMMIFCLVAC